MTPPSRRTVLFSIRDVVHPLPAEVLMALYGHTVLEGEVEAVTERDLDLEKHLVVRVKGVEEPIIVAARHVRSFPSESVTPSPQPELTVVGPD